MISSTPHPPFAGFPRDSMFFLDVLLVLCRSHFFNLLTSVTWVFLGATGDPQSACLVGPRSRFWAFQKRASLWSWRHGDPMSRRSLGRSATERNGQAATWMGYRWTIHKRYGHLLGISWEEDFFWWGIDGIWMEHVLIGWNNYPVMWWW